MLKKNNQGFTLIELLIVIVLIGILSGVLFSVIQPGAQRTRAQQTVMKSNLDKIRMAVLACINATSSPTTSCFTWDQLGVNNPDGTATAPNPLSGTRYGVAVDGSNLLVRACFDGSVAGAVYNNCSTCRMQYTISTVTGAITNRESTGCSVDF